MLEVIHLLFFLKGEKIFLTDIAIKKKVCCRKKASYTNYFVLETW